MGSPFSNPWGSSGSGIIGYTSVNTYADLPTASLYPSIIYAVLTSTGIWPFNKKKGLYISNSVSWEWFSSYPDAVQDSLWGVQNGADPTRIMKFDCSNVPPNTTVLLSVPSSSGVLPVLDNIGMQRFNGTIDFRVIPTSGATPILSNDLVTKGYADSLTTGSFWDNIACASTVNIDPTSDIFAGEVMDGYTLVLGDRILLKNQTNQSENGVYVVPTTPQAIRADDANTGAELTNKKAIPLRGGQVGKFYFTTSIVATVDVDAVSIAELAGFTYTAGDGLELAGSVFSIDSTVVRTSDSPLFIGEMIQPGTAAHPVLDFQPDNSYRFIGDGTQDPSSAIGAIVNFGASGNTYKQVNLRNEDAGSSASADYVVTANDGTDSTRYVDLGINSSGWTGAGIGEGARNAYLYAQSDELHVFTAGAKALRFGVNSTEYMRINADGKVGIGIDAPAEKLVVSGNSIVSGTMYSNILRAYNNADLYIKNYAGTNVITVTTTGSVNTPGSLVCGNTVFSSNIRPTAVGGAISLRNNVGTARFNIYDDGVIEITGDTLRISTQKTPASASATGTKGDICHDSNYIYVCTATNTWKRSGITTW